MHLFETLKYSCWGHVNLNEHALDWLRKHSLMKAKNNPLYDDPLVCQAMVSEVHNKLCIDCSYGGWLEDRSALWRKSYLSEKKNYLHLGVDFNVPAGTPVYATRPAYVVRVDDDHPSRGGWGPRVILQVQKTQMFLLYAHLDPDIRCTEGDLVKPGTFFAKVGSPEHNGHWFSHLHVQALTEEAYREFVKDPGQLDGYGDPRDVERLAAFYPDPLPFAFAEH